MFRLLFVAIFMIFLIAVIGSIVLEQFPTLVPLWEEFKMHLVNLYDLSIVKYGSIATIMIIVGLVILIGSSKKSI